MISPLYEQESKDIYNNTENQFNVIYPENPKATYVSALNFSDDLDKPFQRWFRYKEGFSTELVKTLIKEYAQSDRGTIMDPFAGSGSTLLAAAELGYKAIGFETNPFSFFLAATKLEHYTKNAIDEFKIMYQKILDYAAESVNEHPLPKLSISSKVFDPEVEQVMLTVKQSIKDYKIEEQNIEVYNLLKLGWLACVEELSNYRKAGNGLKKRRLVKPQVLTKEEALQSLDEQYSKMFLDLHNKDFNFSGRLYNDSCLLLDRYIAKESVEGIIFSPPYANCFDYTEIYKLELWFGDFVSSYKELRELRKTAIRSHLGSDFQTDKERLRFTYISEGIISKIEERPLWDKRIPQMLRFYFDDMFRVLEKCYDGLTDGGFCSIVIGNSAYGGVVLPTDLILADYAESIGFIVDKIEVDRFIVPSSQQYKATKHHRRYLRESILCLKKV